MSRATFYIFLILLFGGIVAFPLYELLHNGGPIFYCNGLDESSYLQFDYSKVVSSISGLARVGQYLVNTLHLAGLSAGLINLLFDFIGLGLITFLLLRIFQIIGFSPEDSQTSTIFLYGVPLLFLGVNPFIRKISSIVQTSDLIYWFTMPDASSHPFLRSPEPQVSFLLLLLGIYIALRIKSFFPCYVVTPLLYPFLSVPFLFCVLSLHARNLFGPVSKIDQFLPIISFVTVSLLIGIDAHFFVSTYVKSYMVETHLPLISGMGIVALALHIAFPAAEQDGARFLSWVMVLSIFVGVNTQVLSGWLIQAANYEQYWGSMVVGLMLALRVGSDKAPFRKLLLLTSFTLITWGAVYSFNYNLNIYRKIPWSLELETAIKDDPARVAIDDIAVSSWLSMLYPAEAPLLFTLTRSYKTLGDQNFHRYLCAKQEILKDSNIASRFESVFRELDAAYTSGHKTAPLYTNLRRPFVNDERDLNHFDGECPNEKVWVFLTNH